MVGLSVLSARLVKIQLVDRTRYAERLHSERHSTEILPALRGTIVDRHEEPLATTIPVTSVYVDRNHLNDPLLASFGLAWRDATATPGWADLDPAKRRQRVFSIRSQMLKNEPPEIILRKHLAYVVGILARPLGMPKAVLREKIEQRKGEWFCISKELPQDVADKLREEISEKWIEGIVFENAIKRWYTAPKLAVHLVGYTGDLEEKDEHGDVHTRVVGKFGVESSMEEYLAGRDGWREHYRDARGLVVPGNSDSFKPPRAGLNVKLTIDMCIQAIVEEELDAGLKEMVSERGAVILMDPKTGEVLAMASRPTYENNYKKDIGEKDASMNYAIQAIYEPGSTIKIVATSGALNERLVTPNTVVSCYNGYYQGNGYTIRDAHPASSLTFEGVLQKSNNNGTCNLGRQLGSKRFYEYLHNYGFGSKTGISLSGESSGSARDTGNEVDFSRACFGYATSVTPLQLATAYSVIAGDGNLRKPHIVKALIANDGTVVEDYKPEIVRQVITERTARQMREALEKVVKTGGTATLAAVEGFLVAGKTGTVEKHNPKGGYFHHRYITSFAGMMPAKDPEFVCIVVIDDPRTTATRLYGGTIAGPIFSRIATRVAAHMNLQPTETLAKSK